MNISKTITLFFRHQNGRYTRVCSQQTTGTTASWPDRCAIHHLHPATGPAKAAKPAVVADATQATPVAAEILPARCRSPAKSTGRATKKLVATPQTQSTTGTTGC